MDAEVKKYIDKQKHPQRDIINTLRDIIFKTFPNISEKMKYGVPMYGDMFYLVALKDHVNLGFSLQGLSEKEQELFEGSGKTMKHVKVFSLEGIDEGQIVGLLKLVAEKHNG